jgi:hypothetical protein
MKSSILSALTLISVAGSLHAQTYVYVNDSSGNIHRYDSSDWSGVQVFDKASSILNGVGSPLSMSSGPVANTIYTTLDSGQLATFNVSNLSVSIVGGSGLTGFALGEGRDGYLYMGIGSSLLQINPSSGSSVSIGAGSYTYAGDLAVNPLNT